MNLSSDKKASTDMTEVLNVEVYIFILRYTYVQLLRKHFNNRVLKFCPVSDIYKNV